MSFHTTIVPMSRTELQGLPEKRRRDAIAMAVTNLQGQVIEAATSGKLFHIVDIGPYTKARATRNAFTSSHQQYIPTNEDLVEGFQTKFPDCKVEYTETWEDVRPSVRQQKSGILVDWS